MLIRVTTWERPPMSVRVTLLSLTVLYIDQETNACLEAMGNLTFPE